MPKELRFESLQMLNPMQFSSEFETLWESNPGNFEKIEVSPVFVEDADDSFDSFRNGDLDRARTLVRTRVLAQADMYARLINRGATITRFRVVGKPLTPYIAEYEASAYAAANEIGERVVFVDESKIPSDLQLVCRDMVVFGRSAALVHAYTPWGRMVGGFKIDGNSSNMTTVGNLLDALTSLSQAQLDGF